MFKQRSSLQPYAADELNQILSLLSDLEKNNDQVFVIATTNKIDILDDAILRGGRLGKQIEIKNPDLEGILMIPPATGMPRPVLRQLDTLNLPCVLQISQENVSIYRNLCTIDWDHFKSGYLRMKALLARGHRKIGFVENEAGRLAATDRGIHHALREYGLRQQHLLRSKIAASSWKDPVETGYHQTAELLEHHPELTALLVDTFPGAYGALRAIDERGLRCPADVSLVTAMDMMSYGRLSRPALTTVLGNSEALIERMFQMILGGRSDVPRHVVQDVELIERESIRTLS